MYAAWVSFSVRLPDFARTTTCRWTLAVAGTFVLCTLLLFGFVYWRTTVYMMSENDVVLTTELRVFAANTPEQRLAEIDDRLRKDPRRIKIAGLFDADGHRMRAIWKAYRLALHRTSRLTLWSFGSTMAAARCRKCGSPLIGIVLS